MNESREMRLRQGGPERVPVLLWAILGVALLARLAALAAFPDLRAVDTPGYLQAGKELLEGGRMTLDHRMPLYPAWAYLTGGGLGLKLADIALSVLTVGVLYRLSLEVFDNATAALLAAAMAALYPFFIYYSLLRLSETAFIFLTCSAFLALYRGRFAAGSALLVLGILTRPSLDLLAPVLVLLFSASVHRAAWSVSLRRLAIYFGIYAALMGPWWLHNYDKYGTFVRLNLADGVVLYFGNLCPDDDLGLLQDSAGVRDCAGQALPAAADPVQRNAAVRAAAVHTLVAHPGYFARLAAIKFLAYWRPVVYTPDWRFRLASLLSYGIALTLATAFLLRHGREHLRRLGPLLVFGAYLCAVHVATIANIRYRLPFEPFLIVIAAYAVVHWTAARRRGGQRPGR
jgi:4-amino-4-deoxy-L-arabinose transferase-like glycosyltransferase